MSDVAEIDIAAGVIRLIESTLKMPAMDVDMDADFETFGVNSLIAMELMENIEQDFNVELTPAQFSEVNTINQLVDLLEGLVKENAAAPASEPAQTQNQGAGSLQAPAGDIALKGAVDFISNKLNIDLSGKAFNSVEGIADTLVSEHYGQLLNHYGLGNVNLSGVASPSMDIAIVGISCRFADAQNHRQFWQNLVNGKNSMAEIPTSRWDWKQHYSEEPATDKTLSKWGALIDNVDCFDSEFFAIDGAEARTMDPQQRLLLEENYKAVEDAGIDMKQLAGTNTGVFVGYEYSEYEQYLRSNGHNIKDAPIFSSSSPTYYLSNRLSFIFDLCGPSESINVNCASSAMAVNNAYYSLINQESDLAIASGASLNLFVDDYIASSQYGILSPTGTSAVFDDNADGFVRGEGVAAIVMKRLADAQRDNDNIYSVIKCSHQNNRGFARDISEIKYESITKVLNECYAKIGMVPNDVDYIEVDGYASKWADSFEFEGVKGAFEKNPDELKTCALGSLKGNIGNVESVNGLAAIIKLSMAMQHKRFPATISKKTINSYIDIDSNKHPLYIAENDIVFDDIRRDADTPVRAGVNSFADSGTNLHILLEEYTSENTQQNAASGAQLFVFSAKDASRLEDTIGNYVALGEDSDINIFDVAYTLQTGREAMTHRLAVIASSQKELVDKLSQVQKSGVKMPLRMDRKGVFYAIVEDDNKTVALITDDMAKTQLQLSLQTGQWMQTAMLWVNGVAVDWSPVWQGKGAKRLSLPTYPFAKIRHWAELNSAELNSAELNSDKASPTTTGSTSGLAKSADTTEPSTADKSPAQSDSGEQVTQQWHFYVTDGQHQGVDISELDKIELVFKQGCALMLNCAIDEVATDVNFIDLGLNSVAIAEMIIQIDNLFGINMAPSVIFQHPEIGTLSEYLVETYPEQAQAIIVSDQAIEGLSQNASRSQGHNGEAKTHEQIIADIVVPLQPKGRKRAIFAVPGADGSVLCFQQMTLAFGKSQPLYGLEAVGVDGITPPVTDVEQAAKFNIEAMKTVQAKGPYRLFGYSNGGVVVFEMAKQLIAGGEKVTSLYLLDAISPVVEGPSEESETVEVFKQLVRANGGQLQLEAEQLAAVSADERGEFLYNLMAEQGLKMPKEQFLNTHDIALASEKYCRSYQPQKIEDAVNVELFRGVNSYQGVGDDYGWSQLFAKTVKVHDVDADHFDIIDPKPMEHIVAIVNG